MPSRDLFLSPDHAVFAEDVLIPIKYLMNHDTIRQVPRDIVDYFHLQLSEHQILRADGLTVESYLDTGNRFDFACREGVTKLFPDFWLRALEAGAWASLTVTGPRVEAGTAAHRDPATLGASAQRAGASRQRLKRGVVYVRFATASTAPPASRQAPNPPPTCATFANPISCAVFAASAERQPPAQ